MYKFFSCRQSLSLVKRRECFYVNLMFWQDSVKNHGLNLYWSYGTQYGFFRRLRDSILMQTYSEHKPFTGTILKKSKSNTGYIRSYRTTCRPSETPTRSSKSSLQTLRYRRDSVWNTWMSPAWTRAIRVCWICNCARLRRRSRRPNR